jgi:hypothetical protein
MKKKKYYPKTLEDAIEIDRFRIELILGRKLAPFEELNYTYISNKVEEFMERSKKTTIYADYEMKKFNFFMDQVHQRLDEERAKNNGQ